MINAEVTATSVFGEVKDWRAWLRSIGILAWLGLPALTFLTLS